MKFFPASILALTAACVPLGGCDRKTATAPAPQSPPAPAEDPLATRIGFFAPMSGPQASFGNDAISGARLAVDEINAGGGVLGHPLRLIAKDTQSRPDETGVVVNELIHDDRVSALVGEIASDRSLIAAPLAQVSGVPMVSPGSTNEKVTAAGDFVFRACYTDAFQAAAMAAFARSMNVEKAAILFDHSNPYSSGLAATFKEDFVRNGGKIVTEEFYRAGDKDFASQIAAIKEKAPEVVFLPSYYAEAALVIRQARQLGLDIPFLGTDGWDSPDFLQVGGAAVDNCYFSCHFSAESTDPLVAAFVRAYTSEYAAPPPPLAALAYDAIHLIADALKRAGTKDGPALRDALAATQGFPGVTGAISFDASRNPSKPAVVVRIQGGRFTYLETVRP